MSPNNDQEVVIVGRKVENFIQNGKVVPSDFAVEKCQLCREDVAISCEAASRLSFIRSSGGVCCVVCMLCAILGVPEVERVEVTESFKDIIRTSPEAQIIHAIMQNKVRKT